MPYIVDVPLRDGTVTVKAHSRPSHGQKQAIMRSTRKRAKEDATEELLVDNLLTLCTDWDLRDENGSPVPWSREGIQSAPDDILQELQLKLLPFVDGTSKTFDVRLRELAEDLEDDDPRKVTLLGMVDAGN